MQEVTIGIAGAAGDGLDKSGDTLARSCGRFGLHVYAYNSYQSIIRGGHIWLKVRVSDRKVTCHGDQLNVLVALNQDSIERHAREVDEGGFILFNSDRIKCEELLVKKGVTLLPISMKEVTEEVAKKFGPVKPIMQNTVAIGAVMHLMGLGTEQTEEVLTDTFSAKGQEVIDMNIALLEAGFEYAKKLISKPIFVAGKWETDKKRRPFITGNEAIAMAAYAAGCKFYAAYPMTPASTILHWMATNAKKTGILVKQCEDEISVANMAIGAGIGGVRSMCATAGGGFALMTEAVGMAGIMEVPVVFVEVQRGGPSTGLPTKTEQADLFQVLGASQGEFPRLIVAPKDIPDSYASTVEAFNLADKYQLPVLMMSDLLLSEHPETVDAEQLSCDVKVERPEFIKEWDAEKNGKFKRYKFTESGISPRALPGTPGACHVTASDDHDERGILISDMFTSPPVRRKIMEKRMTKVENMLKELAAPQLEGPANADVTLLCWGSTWGVVREAAELLNEKGIKTNYLCIKYIAPFHTKEVTEILSKAKKKFSVEVNFTSVMAQFVKMQTGVSMDGHITKYDGEPFEPLMIVEEVEALLASKIKDLSVNESEAMEMAYHYLRTHALEKLRPSTLKIHSKNGSGEPVWEIELAERITGKGAGTIKIGSNTGSIIEFKQETPVKA